MWALGRSADAFHYIDGFAGAGLYEGRYPGSPLIALTLLSKQRLPWSVSFVEADIKLFQQLAKAVHEHPTKAGIFDKPFIQHGEFTQFVQEILSRGIYSQFKRVATFAFIDPCGASGVRMSDIARLLSQDYGECLLFWNYDGINRWLGGAQAGTHSTAGVVDLFGDEALVREALAICLKMPPDKERLLRDLFIRAVSTKSGARFVLPFRFEAKGSERTSHYLIHCSNHGLAFKIMKDVMDSASSGDEGAFEFLNDADTSYQMGMFRPQFEKARAEILAQLTKETTPVRVFTDDWTRRPHDLISSVAYKRILLELEEAGEIQVLSKDGTEPMPAKRRPKRLGKATLGDDYLLRLTTTR